MDNVLERLKHIGVEKIREDTNLDVTKIDCILNKRFEKLDSVRAKGFINILEKQYNLDLSSWLEEYRTFHQSLPQEESEPKEAPTKPPKKISYLLWVLLGALGVLGGVLLFVFIPQTSPKVESPKEKTQERSIEEQVNEAPQVQANEEIKAKKEEPQEKEESKEKEEPKKKEEVGQKAQTQKVEEIAQVPEKNISEYGVEIFPNIAFNEENILYIESEKPLWVGIINIDNKKRIAKTKQEFEIPLDKQLLISIARSGFTLNLDEESKEFKGYLPVYLIHTKEGGLREVSKDEFIYLNGGVQW